MSYGKTTLGYWGIRGRGQVIRLLLTYTGADWQDVKYTSPPQWFGGDKESLGLDFPNLPYLIDDNVKLTESLSIAIYVIERSNNKELLGKDLKDKATVLSIEGVLNEIQDNLLKVAYGPNGLDLKDSLQEKIKPKISQLGKFKGNKEWLLGYLTFVDFHLAEISYHIEKIYPALYQKQTFLSEHRNSFNNLSEIKKYYSQPDAISEPFLFGPIANIKY